MKIIAQINPGAYSARFIVEASDDELARIAGYHYAGSLSREARADLLKVGAEIQVDAAWDFLQVARSQPAEVVKYCAKLRGLAELLEQGPPAILNPEAPKQEAQQ